MNTDERLLYFNREGLIPGPAETEEEFFKRCHYCLGLKANIFTTLKEKIPFVPEDLSHEAILEEAYPKTRDIFGIEPHWIPLFFSNYRLSPWQGGCAWIFQQDEATPTGAFFQLRRKFLNSKIYLGFYQRDELMAHELAHVGRMQFQEPQFEEIIAYRTSDSKFRRFFGPFIQSSWESALFFFILLIIFVLDLSLLSLGFFQTYQAFLWLKWIPLGLFLCALARRIVRQKQLNGCLHQLREILQNEQKANAVLFRLQDEEIKSFASMASTELLAYVSKAKDRSPRWKVIAMAYFS